MIYLTEIEKRHKESYLKNYSKRLIHSYRSRLSLSDYYWSAVDRYLRPHMRVLDVGAGNKGMLSLFTNRNNTIVGLDVCLEDLKQNDFLTLRVCGDAHYLPFKEDRFDFIVSQWLLEHLPHPRMFFRESARALRSKGLLLVVSNSFHCPLMLFNAVMPAWIRDRIKKALLPKEIEEDTYPTYYRANTRRRLRNLVGDAGLKEKAFFYASDLSFFIFNQALFAFWLMVDRLTEKELLKPLRMHFLGVYRKFPLNT